MGAWSCVCMKLERLFVPSRSVLSFRYYLCHRFAVPLICTGNLREVEKRGAGKITITENGISGKSEWQEWSVEAARRVAGCVRRASSTRDWGFWEARDCIMGGGICICHGNGEGRSHEGQQLSHQRAWRFGLLSYGLWAKRKTPCQRQALQPASQGARCRGKREEDGRWRGANLIVWS